MEVRKIQIKIVSSQKLFIKHLKIVRRCNFFLSNGGTFF